MANFSWSRKTFFYFVVFLVLAGFGIGYFWWWPNWWGIKQEKIKWGLAEDQFPWRDYTQEELNEMYPQQLYADVETTVAPEETYARFREALLTNDLELALAQLSVEATKFKENKEYLEELSGEGKLVELGEWYPEEIEREYMAEAIAQYCYLSPIEKTVSCNSFQKNKEGVWLISSL